MCGSPASTPSFTHFCVFSQQYRLVNTFEGLSLVLMRVQLAFPLFNVQPPNQTKPIPIHLNSATRNARLPRCHACPRVIHYFLCPLSPRRVRFVTLNLAYHLICSQLWKWTCPT
jgi:hypothetical protein